jgi:hypothetical protein
VTQLIGMIQNPQAYNLITNLRGAVLSGVVYQYADVSAEYQALLSAPSHGRLFHARIRNAFRCRRRSR